MTLVDIDKKHQWSDVRFKHVTNVVGYWCED